MNPSICRPRKSPRFADVHRVISLEGVGAGRKYSVHSDTKALFTPLDGKRLFSVVRTAVGCRASVVELPLFPTDLAINTPPTSPAWRLRSPQVSPAFPTNSHKNLLARCDRTRRQEGFYYAKTTYTFDRPPQDNPNLRTSADNTSVRREWTRRKFQFLARVKANTNQQQRSQDMRGAQGFAPSGGRFGKRDCQGPLPQPR